MFRKKSVLLSICLLFMLSGVFLYGDYAEIQRLRAQGQKEGWTFTVGKTSVSDIPLKQLCGLKIPKKWWNYAPFDGCEPKGLLGLPSSWDWRDYGKVTSVKNQPSSGACWAFAMLGSYEGALLVDGQGSQDLSEQYLICCNSHGYGCNGGWWCFDDMYYGIPMESCCPWVGCDQTCKPGCTKYFPVSAWYYVGNSSSVPSTSALKQAIYKHGPVATAVYVNSAFRNYTGGIFNSCTNSTPNHTIVLVGWDDSGSYWIMKNSWGTGWGESGYMRITYDCANVGYGSAYAIPGGGSPPPDDRYESNDSCPEANGHIDSGKDYKQAEINTSSDEDRFHFTTKDTTSTNTLKVTDTYVTYYRFMNRYSGNALDINIGSVYVYHYPYNGNDDKHWEIIDLENGYYRIDNKANGNSLDVGSGIYVYNYPWNGNIDKHWQIVDLGSGYYRIDNRYSGNSLNVGSSGNYVYHYPWSGNGSSDKIWQIIPVED